MLQNQDSLERFARENYGHKKSNETIFIIGEIQDIYLPENCINRDGFVDIEATGTITCSGLDSYHTTKKLSRLSYAKPNTFPVKV